MNKIVLLLVVLFFISCGEKKEDKKVDEIKINSEQLVLEKEIKATDSMVKIIDTTIQEIEESDKKLENALNDLE